MISERLLLRSSPGRRPAYSHARLAVAVQDWVQVATLETASRLVSCAGSTNVLTATNQEVASSSLAGRANNKNFNNLAGCAETTDRLALLARRPPGFSRFDAFVGSIEVDRVQGRVAQQAAVSLSAAVTFS
jgi:hypothetical protein